MTDKTYLQVEHTEIDKSVKRIKNKIAHLFPRNSKFLPYLLHNDYRVQIFYGLPKIHKDGIPMRPIVSTCQSPTSGISRFLDELLKGIPPCFDSFIKNSYDLVTKLKDILKNAESDIQFLLTIVHKKMYPHF